MRTVCFRTSAQPRLLIKTTPASIILGKVRSFTSPGPRTIHKFRSLLTEHPEDALLITPVEDEGGQRREDLVEVDLAAALSPCAGAPGQGGRRTCLGHSVKKRPFSSQAVGALCGVRFPVNSTERSTKGDPDRGQFPGVGDADAMVDKLKALQSRRDRHLHQDAAVVSWEVGKKKPKTRQLNNLAGPLALGGAFWGMLFEDLLRPAAGSGDRRRHRRSDRVHGRRRHRRQIHQQESPSSA